MDRQRILVAEDHEPILMAIRRILEGEGYTVFTATDGVKALEVMEKVRPDLILADIMMPQMDGYALYEAVRARPEWVAIPFIFLTAKAEREDVLKGKSLGAEDYITKPFDPQELVVAVRARLERARAIREATEAEFDRLKQQIVAILGHELRTPLTYVRGYTELALDDVSSLSPETLQDFLEGIKRGADRLARLVENLLLLVRLDTGRAAEEFRLLARVRRDLAAILERTVRQYEERASAGGVALETRVESNLPPLQLCEPHFADALGQLVDNGIKFSRGMGKRVTVSARAVGGWVEVAVADEGVGIPSGEMSHLFERFRQIGREQMEQQGTGIGLAIARELIHLHGGDIAVESMPGKGSTFTIRLPVAGGGAPQPTHLHLGVLP
jgi:two-component system sensor histidine kinase/response regulator